MYFAYETQRFQFIIRSSLEILSPRTRRKLSENDQRVPDKNQKPLHIRRMQITKQAVVILSLVSDSDGRMSHAQQFSV